MSTMPPLPANGSPLADVGQAAAYALTDGMVERLVTTGSTGLELLDRLNDPDTKAAIHRLLDGVTALHGTGALDTLMEMVSLAHAMRVAATDSMVERLTLFMETMINNLATQEIAELARETEQALYDAVTSCSADPQPTSLWGLWKQLSKPETLQMLNLMVAFGNAMCRRSRALAGK
ncbi:MAG: hypothetical protein NVV74_00645 [Magnetospirillum sp.]|nr:hypothetical protein [Magnetospirillum sp.]